jgi:hypothetical protein
MLGLLKPFLGLATDIVGGIVETKKAKAKQKLIKIEAETQVIQQQIKGEIDWENKQTICFSIL